MEAKHTPGPWRVREVTQNWLEIETCNESDGAFLILSTVLPTQYAALGKSEEQQANAHLIAAAPDLLAALEEINTWLVAPITNRETLIYFWELSKQAIAKATGV